jgi:hypothetical protein
MQSLTVMSEDSIHGIHFELSSKIIYIASHNRKSIYIYRTYDEITFSRINNITTLYDLDPITIHNDKIYTGTNNANGKILVYNKTSSALLYEMDNMCSMRIRSIKFDFNDMIYSCAIRPMVKIIGTNGFNSTLLLNDIFTEVFETYIDSKKRLWIGGNNGFVVYN